MHRTNVLCQRYNGGGLNYLGFLDIREYLIEIQCCVIRILSLLGVEYGLTYDLVGA